jgi:hypothetical protein
MPAPWIGSQLVPHQSRISFSKSASTKLHELSMRRPLAGTSAKRAGEYACSTATSTSLGFCFRCARRQ